MNTSIPFFEGHNDVALRLYLGDHAKAESDFLSGKNSGHIDLLRARSGGMEGDCSHSTRRHRAVATAHDSLGNSPYAHPLPRELTLQEGQESILSQLSLLLRVTRASQGRVVVCRNTSSILETVAKGGLAIVLHLEGAEAIDADLHMLDMLHAAGSLAGCR